MKLIKKFTKYFSKSIKNSKVIINPQILKKLNEQKFQHHPNKRTPQLTARNILITSALPYVNNTPHLGNIIGAVLSADVYARFCRLMGYNTLFICGTDEYGTATQVKALKQKTTPKQICDKYHEIHKNIYKWFDISFDYFGRTSNPEHTIITQDIFKKLYQRDFTVQKQSIQFYCSNCDLFLADRFINGNCKKCGSATRGDQCQSCSTIFNNLGEQISEISCSICKHEPEPRKTKHLYLKLGQQKDSLKKWLIQNNQIQSWTNNAKGVTKAWFNSPAQDRCITRDLKWGVPVPLLGFQKKVFYVWFEAPIGYISITAQHLGQEYLKWWLPLENKVQLHQFMGKDNIIFHSIISPASLMATGQSWILPSHLSVTQYLNYQGGKFSKSNNIGVFGDQCQQTGISVDFWRYYLLRIRPQTFDSQFSWTDFSYKCNKELLNSIGNLFQRVLKYSFKNYGQKILPLQQSKLNADDCTLIETVSSKYDQFLAVMEKSLILQGSNIVVEISDLLNQYVSKTQFWKSQRKQHILGFLIRMLKIYSLILLPFVPTLSAKMNYMLGFSPQLLPQNIFFEMKNFKKYMLNCMNDSKGIIDPIPLIREITVQEIDILKKKFGQNI